MVWLKLARMKEHCAEKLPRMTRDSSPCPCRFRILAEYLNQQLNASADKELTRQEELKLLLGDLELEGLRLRRSKYILIA